MNFVLGSLELTTIGGVGTYLVTVAEQLERMGHAVTVFTEETGEMADIAEERGLRVVDDPAALPDSCDVVYAQDAPSAYVLAARYRDVPQACCLHAVDHDRWVVPQLPGVTSVTVALHDRAARFGA
ncbi:MAG TPA: glycosyltransferase family 4 protein, partial [Candidatus Eisenbacteria bacterium]|nr:glycosyltransferase family 4 protein [Candidatus Eisenbacteria bacterium]